MRVQSTTINLILRVKTPSTAENIYAVANSCEKEIDYFGISELFSKDEMPQQNGVELPRAEKSFLSLEVATSIKRIMVGILNENKTQAPVLDFHIMQEKQEQYNSLL